VKNFEKNVASIHSPSSFKDGNAHHYIGCDTINRGIYLLDFIAIKNNYLNFFWNKKASEL
jgi:hypothetical protein